MELYTLDAMFRREKVIDRFESLIWTERLFTFGDFELVLPSTQANRRALREGTWLSLNESYRLMKVETITDKTDPDGLKSLTIKGRSLEMILDDRIARGTVTIDDPVQIDGKWVLEGPPADLARRIFNDVCRDGAMDVKDVIPYLGVGSPFPPELVAEPPDPITLEIDLVTVYDQLTKICENYGLGMRLVKDPATTTLYFNIYTGSYRTSNQSILPAVIFSPELDNLQNTTEYQSAASYKNVAYVMAGTGDTLWVYAPAIDPDVAGFERKILIVNASDITMDTGDIPAAMLQRGLEELSNHNKVYAFDGEIGQNGSYKYGIDYQLGDIVEMRNVDGNINQMRVVEQIFVSDEQGERSYPTLSMNLFIASGTWLAQSTREWIDFGVDEYWADQP